jgi:hypothetical protein
MAGANATAELDEVMLAMDVVDTIRHQELIVERELNSGERRRQLMARLKSLYAAQGLDVPEHVLAEGVAALEEDRFAYSPPAAGLQTTLARWYVERSRWGKPVLAVLALAAVVLLAWQMLVVRPEAARVDELPAALQSSYQAAFGVAVSEDAKERARALLTDGEAALGRGDTEAATETIGALESLEASLAQRYELRVISRPGELSGVWRVPEANPAARNYYLIVEAVDDGGNTIALPVRNEEDGKIYTVRQWGVRVDQADFERIAADKRDDGIIQDYVLGVKERGQLQPEYRFPTSGAAITSW